MIGLATGQNARRSWSLRNPSPEGYERRRLAAIAGWPRGIPARQEIQPVSLSGPARGTVIAVRVDISLF
jgi:hypothetical protein